MLRLHLSASRKLAFSASALALALALPACGGASTSTQPPAQDPQDPRQRLENATVYDAKGQSLTCGPPTGQCPPEARDIVFEEQCKQSGYHTRKCGCDTVCSGKIPGTGKKFYDAAGTTKACEPPKSDCSPPSPPSAFQDACAEKGHKLETCGCEWLCSGDPSR